VLFFVFFFLGVIVDFSCDLRIVCRNDFGLRIVRLFFLLVLVFGQFVRFFLLFLFFLEISPSDERIRIGASLRLLVFRFDQSGR
jgi:hypothetical protein